MEHFISDDLDDHIPPASQRYMAVWITLAVVLLPIAAWVIL